LEAAGHREGEVIHWRRRQSLAVAVSLASITLALTPLALATESSTSGEPNEKPSVEELAKLKQKGIFRHLRLYGLKEPAIDKSWKPGNIEKVK
jgi:hypothetical protein